MRGELSKAIKAVLVNADTPLTSWEVFDLLPAMPWNVTSSQVNNILKTWRRTKRKHIVAHAGYEKQNGHPVKWRYSINNLN